MTNETLELRKLQKELRIANAIIEKMLKEAEEEKESEKQQKCLEERISTILIKLGIPANLSGYNYLKKAIVMVIEDESILDKRITKILYPEVAHFYQVTPVAVEKSIRFALEKSKSEELKEYFKEKKVTNSAFIAYVVEKLKMEV